MEPNGERKCRGEGVVRLFRLSHPERAEPGRAQPSPDPPLNLLFLFLAAVLGGTARLHSSVVPR